MIIYYKVALSGRFSPNKRPEHGPITRSECIADLRVFMCNRTFEINLWLSDFNDISDVIIIVKLFRKLFADPGCHVDEVFAAIAN